MKTHGLKTYLAVLGFVAVVSGSIAGCSGASTTTTVPAPGATETTAQSSPADTAAQSTATITTTTSSASATDTTVADVGALTGEAASASAGDIPDNQVFLTFRNADVPYSMQYPEGWAESGSGRDVTFKDKNNIARVAVSDGSLPSLDEVTAQMGRLAVDTPSLKAGKPKPATISGAPAVRLTYLTTSAPNPVTGKAVTLSVDRYYLAGGGHVAVVDLGTPKGVDNVDAFRQMIDSFHWVK